MRAHVLCGLLLLISGCSYLPKKDTKPKQVYSPTTYELEARLSDCALPVGFKTILHQADEQQQVIQGTTPLTLEELTEFYEHEMERLGWELRAIFATVQTHLVFVKPHTHKTCLINLSKSAYRRGTAIEIFIKK